MLALRISHVELGMVGARDLDQSKNFLTRCAQMRPKSMGVGRIIGYYGSQASLLGMVGYLFYTVKDYFM